MKIHAGHKNYVVIVIPYYHNDLNQFEIISLEQCIKKMCKYEIVLLCPEHLNIQDKYTGFRCIKVPNHYMDSISGYNRMMISRWFYQLFEEYDYLLIYQLDALVFSDRLLEFCDMGYDYIGAPWLRGKFNEHSEQGICYVGNGGFSLRKVSSFIRVLENNVLNDNVNEDIQFAKLKDRGLNIAPIEKALQFSFEENVKECFRLTNGKIPFGCHAWYKMDYETWRPYFEEQGIYINNQDMISLDFTEKRLDKSYICNINEKINDKLIRKSDSQSLYIYGAGRLGKECGWVLNKLNIELKGYVDSNQQCWKDTLDDYNIFSLDDVLYQEKEILFIVAILDDKQYEMIKENILKKGVNHIITVVQYKDIVHYKMFKHFNGCISGEKCEYMFNSENIKK